MKNSEKPAIIESLKVQLVADGWSVDRYNNIKSPAGFYRIKPMSNVIRFERKGKSVPWINLGSYAFKDVGNLVARAKLVVAKGTDKERE